MNAVTRRRFLLGAGGVAIALPFLETTARVARGGDPPKIKRFIGIYSPNGMSPGPWATTGSGTTFTLGETLQPLEPHRDRVIVLRGVNLLSSGLVDAHREGLSGMLTGAWLKHDYNGPDGGFGNDISIDQVIASKTGTATKIHSLQLGSDITANDPDSCLTYTAPDQAPPKENNPAALFKRLFGEAGVDQQTAARKAAHRTSILDSVLRDYTDLRGRVSAGDRHRLEAHLTAIRDIESRLAIVATCTPPDPTGIPDEALQADYANYYIRRQIMFDLVALALACDLTRAVTYVHEGAGGRADGIFPFLGFSDEHHLLSHSVDSPDIEAQTKLKTIERWFIEGTAYLVGKLSSISEGAGTVMDNTLVFHGSDLSHGAQHTHTDMPYVLVGSAGGSLQTGRVLDCGGVSQNNLLVSILNAFDVNVSTFGHPDFCTGPLAGL